jgi:hypothetical protein
MKSMQCIHRNLLGSVAALVTICVALSFTAGCKKQTGEAESKAKSKTEEKAGEAVKKAGDAAEKAGDAAKKAGEAAAKAGDAAAKAGDAAAKAITPPPATPPPSSAPKSGTQ